MRLEPHRVFFTCGIFFALAGSLVWPLDALGWIPYPGPLHRALMIQGFVLSFVCGFMLTALSGLTHGGKFRPSELWAALVGLIVFAAGSFAGAGSAPLGAAWAVAQAGFVFTVAVLAAASGSRSHTSRGQAPGEIVFILLGLAFGLAGGLWQLAVALGAGEPAPGFALRLVALGMVLSLVLGVGGLLVPTFIGARGPLRIPAVAGPDPRFAWVPRRGGRLWFYGALGALLVASFVAEGAGSARTAAWLRVLAATPALVLAWKLHRLPVRRTRHSFALWSAGWCVLAGLWLAALAPAHFLAGEHLVFLGGYGLLVLAIGTRVTVVHGGFPLEREEATVGRDTPALIGLSLVARIATEFAPGAAMPLLAASGSLWALGWLLWAVRAFPLLLAPRRAGPTIGAA
ncbi:MAG TPA: NnrS family protein [Terriglobales bacterium]|nr:NnrS family protein [Terriglobales bacterium]